jgi:hypothetical protein
VGGETYSEIFLGALLEAGLDSKKRLIYEPHRRAYLQWERHQILFSSVVLEECDLELWMLEAGEGEKRGRGPNK